MRNTVSPSKPIRRWSTLCLAALFVVFNAQSVTPHFEERAFEEHQQSQVLGCVMAEVSLGRHAARRPSASDPAHPRHAARCSPRCTLPPAGWTELSERTRMNGIGTWLLI
jgi:hypothetical protein